MSDDADAKREAALWYVASYDPREIAELLPEKLLGKGVRIDFFDEGINEAEIIRTLIEKYELALDGQGDEYPALQAQLDDVKSFSHFAQIMREQNGRIWKLFGTRIKVRGNAAAGGYMGSFPIRK